MAVRAQTSSGTNVWGDLNTGLGFASNVGYHLRVQLQGANPTTVRARVWRDGTPEPSTWTATNSANTGTGPQVAGVAGILTRNSSANTTTTIEFDNLSVARLG